MPVRLTVDGVNKIATKEAQRLTSKPVSSQAQDQGTKLRRAFS